MNKAFLLIAILLIVLATVVFKMCKDLSCGPVQSDVIEEGVTMEDMVEETADGVSEENMEEATTTEKMTLTSSAFEPNMSIPPKFTCDGDNVNPELLIGNVPEGTASLVLLMDDPDIPGAVKESLGIEKFDHWALYNIPPDTTIIPENVSGIGTEGKNTRGEFGFLGSCPPPEYEPTEHRYIYQLYALDTEIDVPEGSKQGPIREAMEGHILQRVELIGVYDRANN